MSAVVVKLARDGKVEAVELASVSDLGAAIQQLRKVGATVPVSVPAATPKATTAPSAPERIERTVRPLTVALIKELLVHPDGLPTKAVAEKIGVSVTGIGPVIIGALNFGETFGISRRQVVMRDRRRSGHRMTTTLRLGPAFVKVLKSGAAEEFGIM